MSLFSQTRHPTLWRIAQRLVGGSKDKQALAVRFWEGQSKVLEIGCSVGNITKAFYVLPGVDYTGIDIDPVAIAAAKRYFPKNDRVRFICKSVQDFAAEGHKFDYIVVAGMLHHVDDATAMSILRSTDRLARDGAPVVVYDPEPLRPDDSLAFKAVYNLEQGRHLRTNAELLHLLQAAGMNIIHTNQYPIRPGLPLMPVVARFSLIIGQWPLGPQGDVP